MINLVEKYRPQSINDIVMDDNTRKLIKSYLDKGTICNLLLAGVQGIGKTSLANIIVKELGATELYINAGYDNSVDMIRNKVKEFCSASSMINLETGDKSLKVVILDEADALSNNPGVGASAQGALRNIIEKSSDDTRFIMTCNYLDRIMPPLQSRCTPIKINFTVNNILELVIRILKAEEIIIKKEVLKEFLNNVIKVKYPDIRSIVNNLEHWIINGELINNGVVSDNSNIKVVAKEIIRLLSKNFRDARKYYIENEDLFSADYELLLGEIFNLYENDGGKQILIAEQLYKMSRVVDKEIQFASALLQLEN